MFCNIYRCYIQEPDGQEFAATGQIENYEDAILKKQFLEKEYARVVIKCEEVYRD